MKDKKILIIGGSGFIGTHLTNELLEQGYSNITIYDMYKPKVEDIKYVLGDFSNFELISPLIKDCDVVFLLAAMIGVDNCRNNPDLVRKVNFENTKILIDQLVQAKVKRIIFTSSSEVYGNSKEIPYKEDGILEPISVYAKSKVDIEEYLKETQKNSSTTVGIVRLFNVYGPWQKKEFVVSIFIDAALKNENLTIFGNGDQTRTFTFVKDVAKGLVLLSEYTKTPYEIVNLGSNQEYSIKQLAEKVLEELPESTSTIEYIQHGDGSVRDSSYEIDRRVPSVDKAKQLLGFEANVTLSEGLKKIINVMKGNQNDSK